MANEFGYITVPELVELTQKTMGTIERLPKYRGHLMNWYETRTLEPKPPFFISSVDSGNLVASLWTLDQGCRDILRRPLLSKTVAEGMLDHLRTLVDIRSLPKRAFSRFQMQFDNEKWLSTILNFPEEVLNPKKGRSESDISPDVAWFRKQTHLRAKNAPGVAQGIYALESL